MGKVVLTPEVIRRFAAYHESPRGGSWGSLHIVLDEGNVRDGDVGQCIPWAEERGDLEAADLARLLLRMSKSQRWRVARKVQEFLGTDRA